MGHDYSNYLDKKKKKPFYENIFSFNDHISPEYDCLIGLGLV